MIARHRPSEVFFSFLSQGVLEEFAHLSRRYRSIDAAKKLLDFDSIAVSRRNSFGTIVIRLYRTFLEVSFAFFFHSSSFRFIFFHFFFPLNSLRINS